MVTLEQLADWVGTSPADPNLPPIYDATFAMINDHLGTRGRQRIPEATYDQAVLQLGSELFVRRSAPGGIASWASGEVPVRLARDAMLSVYPMINRYKSLGTPG